MAPQESLCFIFTSQGTQADQVASRVSFSLYNQLQVRRRVPIIDRVICPYFDRSWLDGKCWKLIIVGGFVEFDCSFRSGISKRIYVLSNQKECWIIQLALFMITCPCIEMPLTHHFYKVKLGFIRVFFSSYFSLKHRSWVHVRTASHFLIFALKHRSWVLVRTHFLFHLKITIIEIVKYRNILHGHNCVMLHVDFDLAF